MARPIKHNADYFPHENGMRNDKKLKAVRARFGLQGYAVYNMLLESLAESNLIMLRWDELNIEMIAGDFGIESEKLREMVDYFCSINLIQHDRGMILCRQLDIRLKPIFEKRKADLDSLRSGNLVPASGTLQAGAESQLPSRDSKVKKSKVENKNLCAISGIAPVANEDCDKNDDPPLPPPSEPEFYLTWKKKKLSGKKLGDFERFWTTFNYKKDKAKAADAWLNIPNYSPELVDLIIAAAEREAKNRPVLIEKGRTPIYAQGWLSGRRWEDEDTTPPGVVLVGLDPQSKDGKKLSDINTILRLKEAAPADLIDRYARGYSDPDYPAMYRRLSQEKERIIGKYR